jgi:membrane protease YdiL (CAAX protease family)
VAQLYLVEAEEILPRIPVYLSSGALILVLGWVALLVGGRSLGAVAMGIGPAPWSTALGWGVGVTGAAVLLLWAVQAARRALGLRESRLLFLLLPRTGIEKALFAGLSLAAGIGEELAYRGYLVPTLGGMMGSEWGAALASSLVFGILHAYQGWLGVVRTAMLGMLLAASFLVAGTLWPAVLAHALLDLLAGLVLGESLIRE